MSRDNPLVIVVEDDVEMNELQRELLSIHGFDAVAAYTGTEAVDVCRRRAPDAVLLDVMLPEMDGFETCTRLRQQQDHRVPIIIISALAEDECRRQGYGSGADAYFGKPFDPDEVIGTLRRLIHGDRPN